MGRVEAEYRRCCETPSDINEFLPLLKEYSASCSHVTEFGVREVVSTWALLAGRPKRVVSYDLYRSPNIWRALLLARLSGIAFSFIKGDTLNVTTELTDLLFIDTLRTYRQLTGELALHAAHAKRFVILHDTTAFEYRDQSRSSSPEGLWPAVEKFLETHDEWRLRERLTNSAGLTVLERRRSSRLAVEVPARVVNGDV